MAFAERAESRWPASGQAVILIRKLTACLPAGEQQ
jgi:hypothetical protein